MRRDGRTTEDGALRRTVSSVTTEDQQTECQRVNFQCVVTVGSVRHDGLPLEIGFWLLFDGLILDLNLEKFDDLN